jgi:hypothetical protein
VPAIVPLPSNTWGLFRGDANQDGTPDELVAVNVGTQVPHRFEIHAVLPNRVHGLSITRVVDFGVLRSGLAAPLVGDINGDGRPDMVVPQNPNSRYPTSTLIALGAQDQAFGEPQYATFAAYYDTLSSVMLADTNRDGTAELIVRTRGWVYAFGLADDLTWIAVTAVSIPTDLTQLEYGNAADLDGDGFVDLFWVRTSPVNELIDFFCDATAPPASWQRYNLPRRGSMHPFDQEGDSRVELLIDSFEQPAELLLHRIDTDRSGLREVWQQSLLPEEHRPYLKSVLDTNADGLLNVLIASHPVNQGIEQQQIYLNDGTGPLNPAYTFRTNRQFRFFSDLDGNGLAAAVFEDRVYGVFGSRSPGEFDEELIFRPGERAQELLAANFDNDRITDLVTWNRGLRSDPVVEPLTIRRGLGDGRFETVLLLPAPGGASLARLGAEYEAADLNSDGMLDLVARIGGELPQTEIHVAYASWAREC